MRRARQGRAGPRKAGAGAGNVHGSFPEVFLRGVPHPSTALATGLKSMWSVCGQWLVTERN
jgi:hypothetical protein